LQEFFSKQILPEYKMKGTLLNRPFFRFLKKNIKKVVANIINGFGFQPYNVKLSFSLGSPEIDMLYVRKSLSKKLQHKRFSVNLGGACYGVSGILLEKGSCRGEKYVLGNGVLYVLGNCVPGL